MKVLFFIRANSKEVKGGDLVQIDLTAKYLRKIGVEIDYSSDPNTDISKYDIVHVFNSPRFEETKRFFDAAQNAHKPIAFSTIYWPKVEYIVGSSNRVVLRLARMLIGAKLTCWLLNKTVNLKDKFKPNINRSIEKWLFSSADMLLPNSEGEMQQIRDFYHIKERHYRTVRNAVEPHGPVKEQPNARAGVLSVGRIEPRKNTLKLIEACHELGLKLTLIGGYDAKDHYALNCINKLKDYGFEYIPNINSKELCKYYCAAEIHAIVSWYETPGLATMEAAVAGCKIVTTNKGSTIEYFGGNVEYCDPFSYASIKQALDLVSKKSANSKLSKEILSKYTWDHTAQDTIAAYEELLS